MCVCCQIREDNLVQPSVFGLTILPVPRNGIHCVGLVNIDHAHLIPVMSDGQT